MKKAFRGIGLVIVLLAVVAFFVARVLAVISLYGIGIRLWILIVGFIAFIIGDLAFVGMLIAYKIWLPIIIYVVSLVIVFIAETVSKGNKQA